MSEQVYDIKNKVNVPTPEYWDKLTEREKEAWLLAHGYRIRGKWEASRQ